MNILCIGAHPDDVEIGMGGAVLSFLAEGHSVTILDLTDGEPTPVGSHEKRILESKKAGKILGINGRFTLDLENR
ncbi:MAG: PIG-L family deacetylase, partial [Nitrospinota bacterium]